MRKALLVFLAVQLATSSVTAKPRKHSELRAVAIELPNILIHGSHLGRIEIWAVPTGTQIPPEGELVGNARRNNAAGQNEIWSFVIACESPLIPSTEIFVKAFDMNGKQVGRKSLPYRGASEIAHALCTE